jgi:hypothetical protein
MQPTESATLPRGFRYHGRDRELPRTPEPPTSIEEIPRQPSPPRGPRLKIRRRNGSQISAPTEQFLASIAAQDASWSTLDTLDIPRLSIEMSEPTEDVIMSDQPFNPNPSVGYQYNTFPRAAGIAPPRTPAHQVGASFRDWQKEFGPTPQNDLNRPDSALSDQSDSSWNSGGFASRRPSDEGSCTSYEEDHDDPFVLFTNYTTQRAEPTDGSNLMTQEKNWADSVRDKILGDIPWSKDETDHLWRTFNDYRADPCVTPWYHGIGNSAVPPYGVIYRVAREAKHSWKGPKDYSSLKNNRKRPAVSQIFDSPSDCSGSATPTAGSAVNAAPKWPHSSEATREHLITLCKWRQDRNSLRRLDYNDPYDMYNWYKNPYSDPYGGMNPDAYGYSATSMGYSSGPFSTQDIALSLATSTAGSMRPDGPLAQLSSGQSIPLVPQTFHNLHPNAKDDVFSTGPINRLGSPFKPQPRTYGPSASKYMLGGQVPLPRPMAETVAARVKPDHRLGGRFLAHELEEKWREQARELKAKATAQSQSLNGTASTASKRRARDVLKEELEEPVVVPVPDGGHKRVMSLSRPSILDGSLFDAAANGSGAGVAVTDEQPQQRRVRARGFSMGDALRISAFSNTGAEPGSDDLPALPALPATLADQSSPAAAVPNASPIAAPAAQAKTLLPPIDFSSFSASSGSGAAYGMTKNHTWAHRASRLYQPSEGTATVRRRAAAGFGFATMHSSNARYARHVSRHSIESLDFSGGGGGGAGRAGGATPGGGEMDGTPGGGKGEMPAAERELEERLERIGRELRELRERRKANEGNGSGPSA